MANIKFSAFTQKVASADVDFLVGYTGGDNVRITPSVFDDRYLPLAGGTMTGDLKLNDDIVAKFGTSDDLRIQHVSGGVSYIQNYTGDLQIQNRAADKDIIFASDNGSGGVAEYFRLDGGDARTLVSREFRYLDGVATKYGNSGDLAIYHDSGNNYIQAVTGDMYIQNGANDKDIIFRSDDGAGGQTAYFYLDGSATNMKVSKDMRFLDNVDAEFGTGGDFKIYHDSSNMYLEMVNSGAGDIIIQNANDDSDITFKSDNGSGGTTEYVRLDGANVRTKFSKNTIHTDNIKANFGNGSDLQIYHDGSHSYIQDTGTGDLKLQASNDIFLLDSSSNVMIEASEGGSVDLFHNGSKKFETTNTGIKITGVNQYADNAAALAGGLTVGDVYRTGDLLKIVN